MPCSWYNPFCSSEPSIKEIVKAQGQRTPDRLNPDGSHVMVTGYTPYSERTIDNTPWWDGILGIAKDGAEYKLAKELDLIPETEGVISAPPLYPAIEDPTDILPENDTLNGMNQGIFSSKNIIVFSATAVGLVILALALKR